MPAAIPKTRAQELFGEFVDRAQRGEQIDEFTLERLWSQGKKAVGTDPLVGNVLLGAVSSCRFDLAQSSSYFNAAYGCGDDAFVGTNHLTSLRVCGDLEGALQKAMRLIDRFPEDLEILRAATDLAFDLGAIEELDRLATVSEQRMGKEIEDKSLLCELNNVLMERQISTDSVRKHVAISRWLLAESKVLAHAREIEISDQPGEMWIYHRTKLRQPLDRVLELQDTLAVALADRLGDEWYPEAIMIEFLSDHERSAERHP